jgi:hypothetical protein
MKIAFIVPRLEPGKDGVGDVVRRLSTVLRSLGVESFLISWNDSCTEVSVWGHRFKKEEAWGEKGIRSVLEKEKPDWVSLQFIHYAFDSRGLMFSWIESLKRTLLGYRLHIFFHEIWVGVHRGASLKHQLLGWIQKRGILQMVRALRPERIQTSNPIYREILEKNGLCCGEMRHCPGIVPVRESQEEADSPVLRKIRETASENRSREIWILIFGAIHPEARLDQFLPQVTLDAEQMNKRVVLISSGRRTPGEAVWEDYQKSFRSQIRFVTLGELENDDISHLMRVCDFGITTTPYQILGKSSVVVAMLEHGLPVIAYRGQTYGLKSDEFRNFDSSVMTPEEAARGEIIRWSQKKKSACYQVQSVGKLFLDQL